MPFLSAPTRTERTIYRRLFAQKGSVCPYDALLPLVDDSRVSLRVHISRLRRKLPDESIWSVSGLGYRLVDKEGC